MKRYSRYLRFALVYAVLMLFLYLMMVLAASVPNAAIKNNMQRNVMHYGNTERYAFTEDGKFRNVTDNHADITWLNISWHMGTGNPFVSALDTRYYEDAHYDSAMGLYTTVTKGAEANASYTRYWHGTAGVLRLVHLFTDIQGAKNIGFVVLLLLIWNTLRQLLRDGHGDLGLCLAVSLCLIQVWNLRLSVEYLPCFLICFALCPGFLRLERRGNYYVELLAVVSGTLTAFFDFLTTETVTILMPLILVIAVRSKERRLGSPRKIFHLLLRCGLCWLLAYGGTFLLKWAAVSMATGADHFAMALSSAAKRVGGTVTEGLVRKRPGMFMGIAANFSVFFQGTSRDAYGQVIAYLILILLLIGVVYRINRTSDRLRPGTLFLLLLGGLVLLRFGILANHSYMHAFFTYRALASTVMSVLAAITLNLWPQKKQGGYLKWR